MTSSYGGLYSQCVYFEKYGFVRFRLSVIIFYTYAYFRTKEGLFRPSPAPNTERTGCARVAYYTTAVCCVMYQALIAVPHEPHCQRDRQTDYIAIFTSCRSYHAISANMDTVLQRNRTPGRRCSLTADAALRRSAVFHCTVIMRWQ